jgi:SnoaL-like domain
MVGRLRLVKDERSEVTMPTDRDLLISTYNAFNARDIDAVLAVMHPEVDWPNGWEGGRVYGHQGVREYWMRQWGAIDPHVEPVGFDTDEMGRTVVKVHQVVRNLSGKVISEGMVEHVYLIENGLIKSMEIRKP